METRVPSAALELACFSRPTRGPWNISTPSDRMIHEPSVATGHGEGPRHISIIARMAWKRLRPHYGSQRVLPTIQSNQDCDPVIPHAATRQSIRRVRRPFATFPFL